MCMCVRVHNYGYGIDLCSFMCKLVQVINLLPACASEQGNVIGSVHIYIAYYSSKSGIWLVIS